MCIGLLACITSMASSTIYHTYNILGPRYYKRLLKLDNVGIVIMIFGISMTLIYTGFHNFKNYGFTFIAVLALLMFMNLVL